MKYKISEYAKINKVQYRTVWKYLQKKKKCSGFTKKCYLCIK